MLEFKDYADLIDCLRRINWTRGRGEIVSVSLHGYFVRRVPTTQSAGYDETRRFTYRDGRIRALGTSRKLRK